MKWQLGLFWERQLSWELSGQLGCQQTLSATCLSQTGTDRITVEQTNTCSSTSWRWAGRAECLALQAKTLFGTRATPIRASESTLSSAPDGNFLVMCILAAGDGTKTWVPCHSPNRPRPSSCLWLGPALQLQAFWSTNQGMRESLSYSLCLSN